MYKETIYFSHDMQLNTCSTHDTWRYQDTGYHVSNSRTIIMNSLQYCLGWVQRTVAPLHSSSMVFDRQAAYIPTRHPHSLNTRHAWSHSRRVYMIYRIHKEIALNSRRPCGCKKNLIIGLCNLHRTLGIQRSVFSTTVKVRRCCEQKWAEGFKTFRKTRKTSETSAY